MTVLFILSNIISYLRKPDLSSEQLPPVTVTLLDGSLYTLKRGKPVLLHFWATWCRVCQIEASNIETLSKEYEVLTVAVNSGENAAVNAYMEKNGLHFRVLNDENGSWAKQFHIRVFPTTFIYDAEGKLRFAEVGYTTTAGLLGRLKLIE